jgi:HK97 family phage major capsid protein
MRTLDTLVRDDRLPARSAETVQQLMSTTPERTWVQRYVSAVGDPAYERAFARIFANPIRGHMEWTAEEQDAYRRVSGLLSERAGMTTVDAQGGVLAPPLTLDPSVLITSTGSINPLRQIGRTVTIVSDTWQGVTSAGVTAEWLAESSEAADATPTVAGPTIPVYKAAAFVPYSYELELDAVNLLAQLGKLLIDGYAQLTNAAFTTGTGSAQPTGLVTALVASSPSVVVNSGTADTLKSDDVFNLQGQLPPRFQAGASWAANLTTYNSLRQMTTTNGSLMFPELRDEQPTLLGRPAYELSNAKSGISGGADNYLMVYGNFENFVMVDRFPASIEHILQLFGTNKRPTGQRGAFLWARTGSDCVIDNSFRLLDVT